MSKSYTTFSVRMTKEMREQLGQLAKFEDRHPSQVVRRMIRSAYAKMQQQGGPLPSDDAADDLLAYTYTQLQCINDTFDNIGKEAT